VFGSIEKSFNASYLVVFKAIATDLYTTGVTIFLIAISTD
jgi:hypothetical protein